MFFDSIFFTLIILVTTFIGTFLIFAFLSKSGGRKMNSREKLGAITVTALMLTAVAISLFTDLGKF